MSKFTPENVSSRQLCTFLQRFYGLLNMDPRNVPYFGYVGEQNNQHVYIGVVADEDDCTWGVTEIYVYRNERQEMVAEYPGVCIGTHPWDKVNDAIEQAVTIAINRR